MKEINIDTYLLAGINSSWSTSEAFDVVLSMTKKHPDAYWDHDHGAGERWARMILDDRVILILSLHFRIGFIDTTVCDNPMDGLLSLPDLDAACLTCNTETLERLAERSFDERLELSRFSANDIFAMTAT